MWRVRLWLRALHSRFPDAGYAIALVACAGLRFWGVVPWEWTWFVVLPTLFGLAHVGAARETWGGRPYGALMGVWLGAGGLGALAHWDALEPHTPWFSLARYGLIVVGGMLWCLSLVFGRPLFVRPEVVPPRARRLPARIAGGAALLVWLSAVGFIVYLTPFRLAMAPRHPGVEVKPVGEGPNESGFSSVAWSPDSRRLLARSYEGIWLVEPGEARIRLAVEKGRMSRQPWLASGEGFLFWRGEDEHRNDAGVWLATSAGEVKKRIAGADEAGIPSCSPVGGQIALSRGRDGIWIAEADGTAGRCLVQGEGIVSESVEWSPDGSHIVFARVEGRGWDRLRSTWVAGLDGRVRMVRDSNRLMDEFAWVNGDAFAVIGPEAENSDGLDTLREAVVVRVLDAQGDEQSRFRARAPMAGLGMVLCAEPEGRLLAFSSGFIFPFWGFAGRLYLLEHGTGKLWRISGPWFQVTGLEWSPDGKSLAVDGFKLDWRISREDRSTETESGLWLVSGL